MTVWLIRPGDTLDRPVLVLTDEQDLRARIFITDGRVKDLAYRPGVELAHTAAKKRQRERANVMWLAGGSFVMDAKARAAFGGFLSRFGELVELHHGGETLYLFNCTNVIDCLDESRTERAEGGLLVIEAIDESKVPSEPAVFKDPKTVRMRIYVNDAAKQVIEEWMSEAGITGLEIVQIDPL
ncbi:MAG: hypothetical protein ABIR54_07815 [Burkholderiaceae bacterium]